MSYRPRLLSLTAAALVSQLGFLDTAMAQTAPAAEEKKSVVEEITVTGTRVKRKDLTTPAPVTVLSREQVAAAGKVSIGDFLQSLPEQGNAINAQYNNGGDGSTKVNLRSLGQNRTLVLVNGRRMVGGGDTNSGSVDLNSIPTSVVERVEILKDGASAVYGSDAMAGVVNIITRRNYNGTEATAYAGTSKKSDGTTYDLTVTTGANGDRGSVMMSLGYFDQKAVWAGDRSWTSKVYGLNYRTGALRFSGSSATPAGTFALNTDDCVAGGATPTAACAALRGAGYTGPDADNFFVVDTTQPGNARAYGTGDVYNFEPDNYLYSPARRFTMFAAGDAALGSYARAFFEASLVNRRSDQKLAPEPLFTINLGEAGIPVSAASQYNPYGVDLLDVRRRLVEFGKRDFQQEYDTSRIVVGLDGTLPEVAGPLKGWFWELSGNYGRSAGISSTNGTLRSTRIASSIGPSWNGVCYGTAVPNPASATNGYDYSNPIAGCTPLNMLGGPGTITPDQVTGLGFYGADRFVNQLFGVQANTSGEIVRLMSDRPVALALGYEFRRVSGEAKPNPISAAGENSGNNFSPTKGGYNANEGYAELVAPIVSNLPGVDDLELSLAGRIFNYTTFGSDNTYKIGGRWRPVRDVTVRGTYSTAFRAPNVNELFLGQTDSFPTLEDPCAGNANPSNPAYIDPASTLGQRCGSAVNNGDNRTQQRERLGGNDALKAETAKVYTLGVVIEPRWVKGLTLTADYYNVDIKQAIQAVGAQVIVSGCYDNGNQQFCDMIHRGPTGLISFIDDRNTNVGGNTTSGLDFAVRYNLPTEYGRFNFMFDGTVLGKYDTTQADGSVIKNKGNYDQLLAFPTFKANAGVIWGLKNFGAGLSTKYVGSYKECATSGGVNGGGFCSNNTIDAVTGTQLSHTIKAWNSWDAFVSYALTSSMGRTNVTLGVQNLFDSNPPIIYNNGTYQSDPSTYEFMGRFMYVRLAHAY